MTNTLVSPADLIRFGSYDDVHVDAAAAAVRREADWHIAPRITETITLITRRGMVEELPLPTRDFPDAQVIVTAVTVGGLPLVGWDQAEGLLLIPRHRTYGWGRIGRMQVTLTHGFDKCPPDLLPVLAQRASAAKSPRDSRVSSFANGTVQMAFRDGLQMDPTVAQYAVIGGVG